MDLKELSEKYNIDLEALKKEQIKLAKNLELKDRIDFSLVETYGAINNLFINNKILSCIIVCDKNFEIIDRVYIFDKIKFPYIPGFRNYRELEPMVLAFEKLNEKPDVMFIQGHGITHPRLGLASHFALSTGVPSIGVGNILMEAETKGDDILRKGKKIGKVLVSKKESKPMFISPGGFITVDTSYKLCKDLIVPPHKRPEPIHLAAKYSKKVKKELEV